eukprot:7412947-Ditylum_brightwellii.AAC.1
MQVKGKRKGKVQWQLCNDYSCNRTVVTWAHCVTQARIRLFSPQQYCQEHGQGYTKVKSSFDTP